MTKINKGFKKIKFEMLYRNYCNGIGLTGYEFTEMININNELNLGEEI